MLTDRETIGHPGDVIGNDPCPTCETEIRLRGSGGGAVLERQQADIAQQYLEKLA